MNSSFQNIFLLVLLGLAVGANAEAVASSCDDSKELSPHCRAVCRFKEDKTLRADGTFNKGQIIRQAINSLGLEGGAETAADTLECAQRYGPYKATEKCHGIEKFLACLDDLNLKQCNARGDRTSEKCYVADGRIECQGKVHHWPALYMETFNECSRQTNSTYLRTWCTWKNVGKYHEDYSLNLETSMRWCDIMFGKKLSPIVTKSHLKIMEPFDQAKLVRGATEENAIDVLGDLMAWKREGFFQACGPSSMDRLSTPVL